MSIFKKEKEIITPDGEVVTVQNPSFWDRIKPKTMTEMEWARWRRKNLNIYGLGKFCWIILRFIIIFGISFMILYPFIVKFIVSFMSTNDITDSTVMYIPREGSTYFIEKALLSMDYWVALLYTAILSLVVAVFQLAISTFVGYGFARFKFFGSEVLFFGVILTLIIPTQTITIPLFEIFSNMFGFNLLNTFWPLVLMSATGMGLKNGLYIYMMRQFFRGMPKELEASAYIDGAGHLKTFFVIMLPNAMNMMITVFLFAFTWQWTDTTYNDMLISELPILTNTIMNVTKSTTADALQQATLLDTASLLLIAPLLLVFLFCQRYFVQSIERSGLVE
jgi:multiple sugar transport system permease protein